MRQESLEFWTRTAKIIIDYTQCEPVTKNTRNPACGFACVKACRLYGRGVLKIESNKPVLTISDLEEIKRLCNECLGCEYDCWLYGKNCIQIFIPLPGIDQYREKHQIKGGK